MFIHVRLFIFVFIHVRSSLFHSQTLIQSVGGFAFGTRSEIDRTGTNVLRPNE